METWVRTSIITHGILLFAGEELMDAAKITPLGKASDLDGIPSEVVVMVIQAVPHLILKILNHLLMSHDFPRVWKETTVTLIPNSVPVNAISAFINNISTE